MKKEEKGQVIKTLEGDVDANSTFYLVDFKRMKVSQTVELRKLLRKKAYSYKVVKNRLALRALSRRAPAELKPFFEKPTAIAFAAKDPIGLAKILKDYSAQGKILAVKAGVVEGQYLAAERFDEITKLSSRDDLMARFARLMAAPLVELLRTLQAPLSNFGNLLSQLKAKKQD
ncbi:MAG: 50S ribosomal protein L10 [Candidatus Aminicenantales bacterium]